MMTHFIQEPKAKRIRCIKGLLLCEHEIIFEKPIAGVRRFKLVISRATIAMLSIR
jgi:hypothetical protein